MQRGHHVPLALAPRVVASVSALGWETLAGTNSRSAALECCSSTELRSAGVAAFPQREE
jgi:hypothetical protein